MRRRRMKRRLWIPETWPTHWTATSLPVAPNGEGIFLVPALMLVVCDLIRLYLPRLSGAYPLGHLPPSYDRSWNLKKYIVQLNVHMYFKIWFMIYIFRKQGSMELRSKKSTHENWLSPYVIFICSCYFCNILGQTKLMKWKLTRTTNQPTQAYEQWNW